MNILSVTLNLVCGRSTAHSSKYAAIYQVDANTFYSSYDIRGKYSWYASALTDPRISYYDPPPPPSGLGGVDITTPAGVYQTYSHTWINNPRTGQPWEMHQILHHQFGVYLWQTVAGTGSARCTQLYLGVTIEDVGTLLLYPSPSRLRQPWAEESSTNWVTLLTNDGDGSYVYGTTSGGYGYDPGQKHYCWFGWPYPVADLSLNSSNGIANIQSEINGWSDKFTSVPENCLSQFNHSKLIKSDSFEWGSHGDLLNTSGGGIVWTGTGATISTDNSYSGTKSARVSGTVSFERSADISYDISFRFFRDTTSGHGIDLFHGNGSKRINVRYGFSSSYPWLLTYGTATALLMYYPENTWCTLRISNINWNAGTYDIYHNGWLVRGSAPMESSSSSKNLVTFTRRYFSSSAINPLIDDVAIIDNNYVETSWDNNNGSYYHTNDIVNHQVELEGLTGYVFGHRVKHQSTDFIGGWDVQYIHVLPPPEEGGLNLFVRDREIQAVINHEFYRSPDFGDTWYQSSLFDYVSSVGFDVNNYQNSILGGIDKLLVCDGESNNIYSYSTGDAISGYALDIYCDLNSNVSIIGTDQALYKTLKYGDGGTRIWLPEPSTGIAIGGSYVINPQYSFVSSETTDGSLMVTDSSYSTAHNSTEASEIIHDESSIVGQLKDGDYSIYRFGLVFNTTNLPDDSILSAFIRFYVADIEADESFNLQIQGSENYPSAPLSVGDYNKTYYTGHCGEIASSKLEVNRSITINLNSTGLGLIQAGGQTRFILRTNREIAGTVPTGNEFVKIYQAEKGSYYVPKLFVKLQTV